MPSRGIISTFGAFQAFYLRDLLANESTSAISWIGSVQGFMVVFLGAFAGPLFDIGYMRPMILTGSALTVFGVMMTSISTKFYQTFLAQGICIGLGAGITYVPTLALIAKYFTTKRPIAIGIAALGSSVGGVAYPIMFRRLEPRIGFGWTVRCLGFCTFFTAVLICAILCRHKGGKANKARALLDGSALRESPFVSWALALFFMYASYYVPLFFIVSYARWSLGTSEDFAFYMLAVVNGGSAIGRTVPYMLGQRVKPIYTLVFSAVVGALLIFAWIAIHDRAGFVVWCVLWGIIAGIQVTAPTSIMAHPVLSPSLDVIGTRMGMGWGAGAIGTVIGAPIAGALSDISTGDFMNAQIFGGVMMIASFACLIWPMIAMERYDKSKIR